MLPDIEQTDWDAYQQQSLGDQIQQKINSFGLDRMIGDKVAELNTLNAPPLAPKPQPAEPPEVTAARDRYNNQPPPEAPPTQTEPPAATPQQEAAPPDTSPA